MRENAVEAYDVIVSDEAARQMYECVLFLAMMDFDAGERLQKRLSAGVASLAVMPERFPFFNEPYLPHNKYHKMFIEKYYLILYQIQDRTVFVDYVLDCRRDYGWLLHEKI